ncbi:hypothetical protein, partial [Acidocella sp.]|uniref:hypothetical protein n=1 Tax=Acidocella sp. TaxID=50710 RepID=UPI0026248158
KEIHQTLPYMITNQTEQTPSNQPPSPSLIKDQNNPKTKDPEPQKRHQRIPSQTMQLSKNKTKRSNPKTKTTGLNPRREAHQINLAPPRNQVPKWPSVEAASIPPLKFRQPAKPRKTASDWHKSCK